MSATSHYVTLHTHQHTPTPSHFLWSAVWGQQAWALPSGAPLCQQLCHPSAVIHQRPCPSSPPQPETGTQVCAPALLVRCVHPLSSLNLSISEVCVCATFHEPWCWPAGLSLRGVGWNKADMAVLSFLLLRAETWGVIFRVCHADKGFFYSKIYSKKASRLKHCLSVSCTHQTNDHTILYGFIHWRYDIKAS